MARRIIGRFGTPLFFLVVLIAFVVVLSVISSGHPKDWNETTGVIRKIETEVEYGPGNERNETNHVYVEYTVDGKKYDRELGVYMPSYKEGMELLKLCHESIESVEQKVKEIAEDGSLEDFE